MLRAIGRVEELPRKVREEIDFAEERTQHNGGMRLNLAINYGGRAELVDAINAIHRRSASRRDSGVSAHRRRRDLRAPVYGRCRPDPDLLIRTSGEMRVSNFLLWQIAYAELYVTDTLWPDFTRMELLRAVLDFQKRERRFGGLGKRAVAELTVPLADGTSEDEWLEETVVSS